jgi:hypothetical protein
MNKQDTFIVIIYGIVLVIAGLNIDKFMVM